MKAVRRKQFSQWKNLTGTNTNFTHMCTGGNLVVRQNSVVLWKKLLDEKFEDFLLSYIEKKIRRTRIHCTWEPVYC